MAVDVDIDVEVLKCEIKKTYARVSEAPMRNPSFRRGVRGRPTSIPSTFSGAYPTRPQSPLPASRTRSDGGARRARDRSRHDTRDAREGPRGGGRDGHRKRRVRRGRSGSAPFPDESFDVVISNGVIDVIPDKDAVFAGIRRVLVPAGRIQIADVTIQNPVSEEGREKDRPLDRLPALCWRQSTRHSSSATASSESRREIWSRPMRAPHSRTRAARRRSTAREARR